MKLPYIIIFALSLILIISCKTDIEEKNKEQPITPVETIKLSSTRPNLNISILLDLSDRINPKKYPNPAMEFYERDLGYIHSIAKSFELHLRSKRSIKINDHI